MNKHQIKGSAKEAAGKVQSKVGKATANGTQVVKGKAREMAGKAQKAFGDAKEDMKSGSRTTTRGTSRSTRTTRDRDIERRAH